jgi:hypothetical protein
VSDDHRPANDVEQVAVGRDERWPYYTLTRAPSERTLSLADGGVSLPVELVARYEAAQTAYEKAHRELWEALPDDLR